jgi:plasmid maintenance system antidote protein VapI
VLYGHGWQTELAKALGVTDRSMRRWIAGDHEVPEDVTAQKIRKLIDQRIAALRAARQLLSPGRT